MTLPKPIQTNASVKTVFLIAIITFILLAVTSYLWFLLPQPVLVFSIPIRLAACIIAVAAFIIWKDWRVLPLALMFFLMAFRQTLTLLLRAGNIEKTSLTTCLSEVPGFIVTLLSLTAIIYLWRLFSLRLKLEKAEQNLTNKELQLKAALQVAKMGHWSLNLKTNRLIWSEEIFNIFELDTLQAEPSFELFIERIHPDDREFVKDAYAESLRNKNKYDIEHRIMIKDGSEKWLREICTTKYDKNGDPFLSLGIVQDITARKQQEKKMLQNLRLQEECKRLMSLRTMAGAIAHRLNNSMTAILGHLELLEQNLPVSSPASKGVITTLEISRSAAQIGTTMLTYVGQKTRQLKTEDLVKLVQNSIEELKTSVPPTLSLQFTPSSEPLYCSVDSQQIKGVVNGVFINAIESFQEGKTGTIEITFGNRTFATASFPPIFQDGDLKSGVFSFCRIKDNGNGISKDDLEKIFEPFFSTKFVGRGLSLAMAAGIMRSHRGAIIIESAPGQGTVTQILLPAPTATNGEV